MKSIAEISKETGIHENTLRKYARDFQEYLPCQLRQGRKKYTSDIVKVFKKIYDLYQKRYSTSEIRNILALDAPIKQETESEDTVIALKNLTNTLQAIAEQIYTLAKRL